MTNFIDRFEKVNSQLESDIETYILENLIFVWKTCKAFASMVLLFGFEQLIDEPSRITENISPIIDLIYMCNKLEKYFEILVSLYWYKWPQHNLMSK